MKGKGKSLANAAATVNFRLLKAKVCGNRGFKNWQHYAEVL